MIRNETVDERFGARRSGVYRIDDAQTVLQVPQALAAGFDIATIPLSGIAGKRDLLDRFATALAFPEWFGGNWDALEDCLSDLSWREANGQLLVIEGSESFQTASRDEFGVLLDVLAESAGHWLWQERPFFAVFVDPGRRLALPAWDEVSA